MRLLRTDKLESVHFPGQDVPPFVILSHTWDDEEVLFQDIQQGTATSRRGIQKVYGACEQARKDGFRFIWIDTCCIDKTSSAELSEAINSMFQWYGDADVCYAFLSDVDGSEDPHSPDSGFQKSRWFTRGWTLQELIAPPIVIFYDEDWDEIGSRAKLQSLIVSITNINAEYFETMDLSQFSAAQKMSWASNRQTTRVEDMAYCLLGLFDINMPLLYGEGEKAFLRLQEEILRQSEDDSLF
ncbi:heterokaryon incompatibility protein-domain-containing protein, partial [Cladorrhinum samala]